MSDRTSEPGLESLLGPGAARRPSGFRGIVAATGMALAVVLGLLLFARTDARTPRYETADVSRGRLVVTVSATGTLEPTNQVDVGSELSGLVRDVMVDENDRVSAGQVLAQLDVSKLEAQLTRSKASLTSAEAKVMQADATTKEARASLTRLRAVAKLSGGKVPSRAEMVTAEATLERATADAAAARASVSEARAALDSDATSLEKASIRSPIDGVVLSRGIEPGQTVAASFETPVLFTLAEDLAQMELEVDVDEADVGQVQEGQRATFTVDAHPGRAYPARIVRVGLGSQTTDGVVSYATMLTVENADLSLRPGMTATAEIVVSERDDALLVPSEALRYSPPATDEKPKSKGGGILGSLLPRPPGPAPKRPAEPSDGNRVWVLRDGETSPVDVVPGASDGRRTEILDGPLEPGMQVVLDVVESPA